MSDADVLLTFCLRHVTGWREERMLPRGVAAGAGAEKKNLERCLSLYNKDKVKR